jgi:hypothetical protein
VANVNAVAGIEAIKILVDRCSGNCNSCMAVFLKGTCT